MDFQTINRNLSVSANYFNVSIFRESWLINEGIIDKDDIDSTKSFFSPNVVHISNDRYELIVQPPEVQIYLQKDALFTEFSIIEKIIKKLPHIPYLEAELSAVYLIEDFEGTLGKTLFFNSGNKIFKEFNKKEEEPRFGAYLSKDYLNARFKFDLKPVTLVKEEDKDQQNKEEQNKIDKTFIKVECLLNKEFKENQAESFINEMITNTELFYKYSENLIEQI
jgi:hypothetical protein